MLHPTGARCSKISVPLLQKTIQRIIIIALFAKITILINKNHPSIVQKISQSDKIGGVLMILSLKILQEIMEGYL